MRKLRGDDSRERACVSEMRGKAGGKRRCGPSGGAGCGRCEGSGGSFGAESTGCRFCPEDSKRAFGIGRVGSEGVRFLARPDYAALHR